MRSYIVSGIGALAVLSIWSVMLQAQAPLAASAYPWEGEVTATNVYVRSGAGTNWYPTAKLNKGDRVLVLGEKFGWYQVSPPPGSFSYVDMAMVDRPAGAKKGTIKQDKVYIRAGSRLEQRKNSTQVVLNKGETVDIIGEADGFLKINPPPGAALYISKQYVQPVDPKLRTGLVERHVSGKPMPEPKPSSPAVTPSVTPTSPPATPPVNVAQPSVTPPTENSIKIPTASPVQPPAASPPPASGTVQTPPGEIPLDPEAQMGNIKDDLSELSKSSDADRPRKAEVPIPEAPPESVRYKTMLTVLEGELISMLARPLEQQDVESLRKKYEEIANQADEYVPAEIAKIRMRQLKDRAQLRLARTEILADSESIAAYRANMDQERMKIMRRRVEAAMVKYDLEGELWRSYAFAPESKRFRLVDPTNKNTIAYVDIPAEIDPNPDHLIGRLIGITTSGQKFSPSARVPIAVAASITDLSPRNPAPAESRAEQRVRRPAPIVDQGERPEIEPASAEEEPQSNSDAPANSDEIPEPAARP